MRKEPKIFKHLKVAEIDIHALNWYLLQSNFLLEYNN